MTPLGLMAFAEEARSLVLTVVHGLIRGVPNTVTTSTCHWMVPVGKVPFGTVTFCSWPVTGISVAPEEADARQRKVALFWAGGVWPSPLAEMLQLN